MRPLSTARLMLISLIAALGIAAAWAPAVTWCIALVQAAAVRPNDVEQLVVSIEGEPIRVRYPRQSYVVQQTFDLSGESRAIDAKNLLQPMFLEYMEKPSTPGGLAWHQRLAGASNSLAPPVYWYLLHDGRSDGQAFGVGYHSATKQVVGYFGRSGFSPERPERDQWFNIEGQWGLMGRVPSTLLNTREPFGQVHERIMLLADGKLWSIDLDNRKLQVLANTPGMQEVGFMWRLTEARPQTRPDDDDEPAQTAFTTTPQRLVLRGAESFAVVDKKTGELTTVPLPAGARQGGLAIHELPDQRYLLIRHGADYYERDVFWIDAEGQVEQHKHLELSHPSNFGSDPSSAIWVGVAAIPHVVGCIVAAVVSAANLSGNAEPEITFSQVWPAALTILAIGAIAAAATYRRQKYFGLPNPGAWAAFSFLLGVPGWLAYRWHRTWPVLEPCPACSEPAPQDRPACAECGASFPAPSLKGIEVYA